MLIDKHTVKIVGSKWDHKKDKRIQDQVIATYQSTESMDIKKLSSLIEELADSHNAHHNITFNIVMKQYDHD